MALDRVQPLKIEDTETGTEEDLFPTALDRNEDFVDCHGITLQSTESDDDAVVITRDGDGNMTFLDVANTVKTLAELAAGSDWTADAHKIVRQLIHFIETGGPAEGFASGAYREITGGVFPTSIIWWESSAKLKKIVERGITWGASPKVPTQDQWKVYDTDGSSVLATVTDTITHSGAFETSRTRAVA